MLPKNWEVKTIGEIAIVRSGGTPSRNIPEYWNGGTIPWIRTTEVQNCVLKYEDAQEFISDSGLKNSSAKLVPEGTILLAMIGQGKTRGQVALLKFEACTNQNCAAIILNEENIPEFHFNFLLSQYEHIRALSNSAGQSNLSSGLVKSIKVLIPPLVEQKKIARILSTWDKAITTAEQLLANSQQHKRALMNKLLVGEMRVGESAGALSEYKLEDVAEVIVSPVDKKTVPNEESVSLCNYTDVYYNRRITREMKFMQATATKSEKEKYALKVGDVVITKDSETPGDIAVPAYVSEELGGVICGYHLAIIRADGVNALGEFIAHLFALQKIRYYFFTLAAGATRFGLSVGGIRKAAIKLPSIEEQKRICSMLAAADHEVEGFQQKLSCLKQEKKALMQQLLTGRRRVLVDCSEFGDLGAVNG